MVQMTVYLLAIGTYYFQFATALKIQSMSTTAAFPSWEVAKMILLDVVMAWNVQRSIQLGAHGFVKLTWRRKLKTTA